jgi:lipopolysaccharide export system permease protein
MRLLDRYQLREFLGAFGYCLAGILVFWLSFELLGGMDELRRRDLAFEEVLLYLWHRLPLNLLLQIPVALLLSLLYVLAQHSRHNELIAMRAAGRSMWRISVPYLGVGVLASLALMAVNEYAVPDAAARAEAVLERRVAGAGGEEARWRANLNFRDEETGRIWWLQRFQVDTAEIQGLHVQWPGAGGGREELIAEHGHYEDGSWVFEGVTRLTFPPGNQGDISQIKTNRLTVSDFPETPAHLRSEVKISRMLGSLKRSRQVQLSLREIRTYRELHRVLSPEFDARLRTWFHDRLASPWTCLVVILIGIPAGAGSGRRNVFVGVAAAILMAFAYFVLKEFSLALGTGSVVPPWLAAWMPNLVFAGLGALGILRMR